MSNLLSFSEFEKNKESETKANTCMFSKRKEEEEKGNNFCIASQYRDIFGKPGTGVHSLRLFNVAIFDVIGTIIGATILAILFKWSVLWTNVVAFFAGILLHRLFCVNTTLNKLIFGSV
jgi:fatty acid desaturase